MLLARTEDINFTGETVYRISRALAATHAVPATRSPCGMVVHVLLQELSTRSPGSLSEPQGMETMP